MTYSSTLIPFITELLPIVEEWHATSTLLPVSRRASKQINNGVFFFIFFFFGGGGGGGWKFQIGSATFILCNLFLER